MANEKQERPLLETLGAPRRKGADRRALPRPNEASIFLASLEAFGEYGFNGASMRDIANRAGTSLSNLYNYVPSKGHLLANVLRRANDHLQAELAAALASASETPTERLRAAVTAYVRWSVQQQTAGIVALGEFRYLSGAQRELVAAERDKTQGTFTNVVAMGVETGEFGTPYPREAARNIVLLCAALATWYRPDGGRSVEELAAEQSHLALAMVEARDLPSP